jgi:hypothetical protein
VLPYTNAILTAITGPGNAEDYDVPATTGTARWTGSLGIYYDDSKGQLLSPGRADQIDKTRLEIPYTVGNLAQLGDTVTFTVDGVPQTGMVAKVEGDPLLGRRRVLLQDR